MKGKGDTVEEDVLRVGELARRTGLTVRTLHHWEAVGLIAPRRRNRAGHRLFGTAEVRRLQRITSLRTLGMSLNQIKVLLDQRSPTLEEVLTNHRESIREQRRLLEGMEERLDRILSRFADGHPVADEELLETMENMAMIERHFSPEQLEELKKREDALGPEAIREAQEAWPALIARVREEMEKGTDPGSETVQALAKEWNGLIKAFSGGNAEIEASLAGMYRTEPEMATQQGMDPALFRYIGAAMQTLSQGD
jgi:DNA-binding transcriptional MerR regulator